jgi:hypothetical protein
MSCLSELWYSPVCKNELFVEYIVSIFGYNQSGYLRILGERVTKNIIVLFLKVLFSVHLFVILMINSKECTPIFLYCFQNTPTCFSL